MMGSYHVWVKVYYGPGVDGTETVGGIIFRKIYCDGKCKADFGDIRFTSGEREADYCLEEKSDGDCAIFRVKVIQSASLDELASIHYGDVTKLVEFTLTRLHKEET